MMGSTSLEVYGSAMDLQGRDIPIKNPMTALLVRGERESWGRLIEVIEAQGILTLQVPTSREAIRLLRLPDPPELVFAATVLPDGRWSDLLAAALERNEAPSFVVVSPQPDTDLYSQAIQSGAFDFISPPFVSPDLEYIVKSAVWHATSRQMPHPQAA